MKDMQAYPEKGYWSILPGKKVPDKETGRVPFLDVCVFA
jgi:hypothetical protein